MRQFENLKMGSGDKLRMWQGLYPAIAGMSKNESSNTNRPKAVICITLFAHLLIFVFAN